MNKLKVNRRDLIDPSQIKKIVIKGNQAWLYLKKGNYPPILKTTDGICMLEIRLINLLLTLKDFEVEYE